MKRIIAFLFALLLTVPTCFAYSVPDSTIVYVTPSGTKYHRADCTYITTVRSLTIQAAEQQGYSPCSRCNPDFTTGEYESDWDGTSGTSATKNSGDSIRSTPSPAPTDNNEFSSVFEIILTVLGYGFLGLLILGTVGTILSILFGWIIRWFRKRRRSD